MRRHLPLVLALLLVAGNARAQSPSLVIDGDVPTKLALTAADIRSLPRERVDFDDLGRKATYEGVRVSALLAKAGVDIGHGALHGKVITTVVLATAVDGYQAVFSLGELDSNLAVGPVIIADRLNDLPLAGDVGPWRVVSVTDGHPSRWVRQVVRLTVVRVTQPAP